MVLRPEDIHPAICVACNAGDLDGLVALYDLDAVYFTKPGQATSGPAELRAALARVTAAGLSLTIAPERFEVAHDLMLVSGSYTLAGRRRDGTPLQRSARFTDVLRRQTDGGWLIAVDNPHG